MKLLFKAYDALLYSMAGLAGASLLWLMVSVVVSVVMRNLGMQPFAWLFTSAEYGLLYMTMLGAPWLVRVKGHVHIELLTAALPTAAGKLVSRIVAFLCVLVCLILAWYGLQLLLTNIQRNDFDVRAYYFPRWLLTITFPLSFGLMTIEFARFVFGQDRMHSGEAGHSRMMEWYQALAILLGAIVVLMAIGMPVALAFLAANILGAWIFMGGERGIVQLLNNGLGSLTSFALVPIPLFLLMGEVFFHTGLGGRMFSAIDRLLGRLPGRLSYVTVIGGTAFSTLSGSSMGSTALLGSLMVPEMNQRGYKKHMSIGPILGTGGLAIIIPPSALAVLLATLAQIDVAALLIAGIIPGLLLAMFYIGMIALQTQLDPTAAPAYDVSPMSLGSRLRLLITDVLPMISVMVLIVVLMIKGIVTPSEAAAFGALGVLLLAAVYGCLSLEAMKKSLHGALRVTLMAYLIVFGSATFSQLLAFSGASSGLIDWATGFDLAPLAMLLVMFAVLLLLGMFMEQISMMLLTVPIFFPLAQSLGFDPVWFGVIMLLALEISFTTPPFGLLLFVMKGVSPPDTSMRDIYLAAMPFIGCSLLLVALLVAFPGIALWLPNFG